MRDRAESSTMNLGPGLLWRGLRRVGRMVARLALAILLAWFGLILLYRWVDPPITPLMLLRLPAAGTIHHTSVPLNAISVELRHAVIASEDNRFCFHHGIDWEEVSNAVTEFEANRRLRGASTITMQTARNLLLWPGGGFFRKGLEAGLALAIDALWPKRRILEVYLNVIEWGNGVYGAEAAANAFFTKDAAHLTRHEAALMAAVLPSPRRWSRNRASRFINTRASVIAGRIDKLEGYLDCAR